MLYCIPHGLRIYSYFAFKKILSLIKYDELDASRFNLLSQSLQGKRFIFICPWRQLKNHQTLINNGSVTTNWGEFDHQYFMLSTSSDFLCQKLDRKCFPDTTQPKHRLNNRLFFHTTNICVINNINSLIKSLMMYYPINHDHYSTQKE